MMYLFYTVVLIIVILVAIFIYNKIKKNKKNPYDDNYPLW